MFLYLTAALCAGLTFSGALLIKKKRSDKSKLARNIFTGLIAIVFFAWFIMTGEPLLENVIKLKVYNPYESSVMCFFVAISVWLFFLAHVSVLVSGLFEFKLPENLLKTAGLVGTVLSFVLIKYTAYNFTKTYDFEYKGALYAINVGMVLGYTAFLIFKDGYKMNKEELKSLLIFLPLAILWSLPPYIIKNFFGLINVPNKDFGSAHRFFLYFTFLSLVWIYCVLKDKKGEYSRMVLLWISIAALISYTRNYYITIFITPTKWPLHLCNTAMFLTPICLLFRTKRLYYFTLFINVIGALFAMLMPNYNDIAATTPHVIVFWVNHVQAFIMPLLLVLLDVYERPKVKHFLYSMIPFAVYFIGVLFINAWFTNYDADVDFFFLNSDFIVDKLGKWAEDTRNLVVSFNIKDLTFTFYPVYQALFYLVYVAFGLGMWFVYVGMFSAQDFYTDVRLKNRKIKQDELILASKYGKKDVNDCMNTESVGKLKVSGFSKKYGKNAIFAVEDLNFEVNSGEILGFLGPNGAGKSTTIKCIVGIQPPTKGEIEINGYDIVRQPVMAKKQLGFVPDHYALYENLTGREYLNYIADLYEVNKEDRDAKMAELLKTLNMEKAIDNQMHTYSHGMKQKMTIMASIIHNPKLWILDEPLTGLDPISIFQVKECMKDHAAKGNIVFFSSHIIDIIEKICTRIIIINNHHVAANITLKELAEKGIGLEEFYLKTIGQEIVGDEVKAVSSDKADGETAADENSDVKTEKDGEDK